MESLLFATYINSDINYFLRRDDAMYSIQALKSPSLASWVLGLQAHTNVPFERWGTRNKHNSWMQWYC